jgi:MFS transporter, CP family, cyanate transporter
MPSRAMPLVLLWLSGAALRLSILAVPPVIPVIRSDLALSATAIGLLSGLPVLLFAVAALPGSMLIARLGGRMTLVGGLFIAALGAALRGVGASAGTLYAATAVMGAGVAIMQPSMPVLTREWLPSRIGFATAVYSNGLLVGEILPVWLAVPVVMPLLGGSWRFELAIWSLPVLLIGVLVLLLGPAAASAAPRGSTMQAWWPDWRNPLIWHLGILFGSVNAVYFSTNAFLPAYLSNTGRGDLIASALTALNLGQLPVSLAILPIATRLERRAWPYVVAGTTMTAAVIGIVAMTGGWVVFCAALLGCAGAASLILGLTLPPLLSEPGQVGRTSAAMFSISYASAMIVALVCGAIWDVTGLPGSAFAPIGFCTLVLSVSALGLRAAKQLR